MATVEVCFSPALYPFIPRTGEAITVVIDILRATTSFCTAFDHGAGKIIPLDSLQAAFEYKKKGELVAAERDGLKPEFADFSNSAFDFMTDIIASKTIYYTTTNGTEAIKLATGSGRIAIGSFLNVPALTQWLKDQNEDIILLCSGWKNNYCIEDTLCAGLIAKSLIQDERFTPTGDSTTTAVILWDSCKGDPETLIRQSSHYQRLQKLGYENVLEYSLEIGRSLSVPVLHGDGIINLGTSNHNKIS